MLVWKPGERDQTDRSCTAFPLADFVLEVDENLSPGARLVLGKQWKQSDEPPPSHADTESLLQRSVEQQQQQEEEETEDTSGM